MQRRNALLATEQACRTAQQNIQQQILNLELKPGVTVLDMLSLPTWMAERDAEAGALTGLRHIRQDFGINLLVPFRDERTPARATTIENLRRENADLPTGIPNPLPKIIAHLEQEGVPRTVLEEIRLRIMLLEASPEKLRALMTGNPSEPSEPQAA